MHQRAKNRFKQTAHQGTQSKHNDNLSERLTSKTKLLAVLLLAVCAIVLAAHWPALSANALLFDDGQYLIKNVLVQNPGWASARQFLSEALEPSSVHGYYQPLSMISLMIDYALGGRADNLMPFHRTSLALHIANTALIIVLLYLLFGRAWIAAAAGLLFGVHPLTVEPIPWVGERKTLLAAFFALWCLILYVRYTRKNTWQLYVGCFIMYVLALMSKPTSTPLPVLMLLLDYWPLNRLRWKGILEKLPFFIVGGVSAIITYISQGRTGGVELPVEYGPWRIPLVLCHNIVFYLYKIIWPANLSSHYAFPKSLTLSHSMVLAGVIGTCILIALLVISLRWTKGLLAGWLFFFIAILPAMQIIGFSNVIASDKFAYLPSLGLLMILTSFLGWLCRTGKPLIRLVVVVIIVVTLAVAESVATRRYLAHWRDTMSLCKHMLALTPDAAPVHVILGVELQSQGKLSEAVSHYLEALRIDPQKSDTHNNLGSAILAQGKLDEAVAHFNLALRLRPRYDDAHCNLGIAFESQGKPDEAVSHYLQAIEINPNNADAHYNLANLLQSQGRLDDAISHYQQAMKAKPGDADAHYRLANALQSQNRLDQAMLHYRDALRLKPDWLLPLNRMALILATHPSPMGRKPAEAIALARRAAELTGYRNPLILSTLAEAYAASGQIDLAVKTARTAKSLAESAKADELLEYINKQLELYTRPAER